MTESYQMKLLTSIGFQLLPLLLSISLASPCEFPAIFNLGDSNSDTGGFSATFGPLPLPFGKTFFHIPSGRFSDGRLIIDFIAERLRLPHLSSYLDSVDANFSHGANFATALSTIITQNLSLDQGGYSPFSLAIQTKQLLQFKARSTIQYKKVHRNREQVPREEYFSKALYTLDIGQNDLTALYFSNQSAEQYISNAMKQFAEATKIIYKHGGRHFWIHNTGPLGCLPYVLVQLPSKAWRKDRVGCAIFLNELAQKYNMKLNETVVQLRRELPLAAFTYVDVYAAKYLLISNAAKFGFEHPLMACCGHGGGEYNYDSNLRCGSRRVEMGGTEVQKAKACGDSRRRINWDGAHYTEAANKWVFDLIVTGAYSYPSNSLTMACHKNKF